MRDNYNDDLPKEKWDHMRFSGLEVLNQENDPPEHLALMARRAYFQGEPVVGNRDSYS